MMIDRKNGKIYCILKDAYLIETPEERVRQEYIHQLIDDYGYNPNQMAQEVQVNNSQRGQGKARADIVIWKSEQDKKDGKKAFIVVECKAENVRVRSEDYYQGYNYASWAGARFFVTTNQKETKFFNVDKEYLPKKLDEILALPLASQINDEKKIKELLNQTKTFTREEFTHLLFACHNIIRNNDKLSPEAAFDEISKILFMKIKYEREQKGVKVFTQEQFIKDNEFYEKNIRPSLKNTPKDLPYMQFMFYNTKEEFKKDELFEDNEIINIRQNSFESIIELLEKYNLSDTQDDVKGIAFEKFLGKTFRGELGQFFTPRTIVDFMTHILDPKEGETICDPTCGSGGFLIRSFEYIREKIETEIGTAKESLRKELEGKNYENLSEKEQIEINKKIDKMQLILNQELDSTVKDSRLYNLSYHCIYGTDANPRMARTSKMNMIMHGDGHGGVHHHDGLLNINGIFEERFDVVLTNPPFGARVDKDLKITDQEIIDAKEIGQKLYKDNEGKNKTVLSLFDEIGKMSSLTEVLFMDRCLKLLKKGGRMGMVLPEGVLNTSNLQKVRDYFESKAKIILICSIPQDVFIAAGAMVKPSLVFFKRFTEQEELEYNTVTKKAQEEIRAIYNDEIVGLNRELEILDKSEKSRKKEIGKRLTEIEKAIIDEAKPKIKVYFNYEIPIAKVDMAGITTTGGKCDNELEYVEKEFKDYNNNSKLWESKGINITYAIKENKIYCISGNSEQKLGEL